MENPMQRRQAARESRDSGPNGANGWAESPVLYLLTCYDVWSATPPRGCDPAPAVDMRPAD